jgi:hypothetical protein
LTHLAASAKMDVFSEGYAPNHLQVDTPAKDPPASLA